LRALPAGGEVLACSLTTQEQPCALLYGFELFDQCAARCNNETRLSVNRLKT
jgi:hypothetical protein